MNREVSTYKKLVPGGIKGTYKTPDTLREIIDAIGEPRVLALVTNQVFHHNVKGFVRTQLSKKVEEATKQAWKTETRTVDGKSKQVIIEDDEDYTSRAVASGLIDLATLTVMHQAVLDHPDAVFINHAKEDTRTPGGSLKLPKDVEAQATALVNEGYGEKLAKKLGKVLGRTVDGTNVIDLGRAIRDHRNAAMAAAKAKSDDDLKALIGK
jgi:hypothetical protein